MNLIQRIKKLFRLSSTKEYVMKESNHEKDANLTKAQAYTIQANLAEEEKDFTNAKHFYNKAIAEYAKQGYIDYSAQLAEYIVCLETDPKEFKKANDRAEKLYKKAINNLTTKRHYTAAALLAKQFGDLETVIGSYKKELKEIEAKLDHTRRENKENYPYHAYDAALTTYTLAQLYKEQGNMINATFYEQKSKGHCIQAGKNYPESVKA